MPTLSLTTSPARCPACGRSDKDIAVLNIGGIANITWLGADGTTSGFDTGPGNMLMDALMLTLTEGHHGYDANGKLAAKGSVCRGLLDGRPRHSFTLQIGDPATIAEKTGITTISNFRSRDIAAGGQGAPLVPFAHRSLFGRSDKDIAVLNIGGIANITWLGADGTTSGFDTGPGNMLMDALMLTLTEGHHGYDANGKLAAKGSVCRGLLDQLMQPPFLKRHPPKSTGREGFGQNIIDQILAWPNLSDADRLATACAFTTCSITSAIRFLPGAPDAWLICGGGTRNPYLMQTLTEQLASANITTTETAGIPPQAVEAVSFAILAHRTILGQSNVLSAATGASRDVCGGVITPGHNWPELLRQLSDWIR